MSHQKTVNIFLFHCQLDFFQTKSIKKNHSVSHFFRQICQIFKNLKKKKMKMVQKGGAAVCCCRHFI